MPPEQLPRGRMPRRPVETSSPVPYRWRAIDRHRDGSICGGGFSIEALGIKDHYHDRHHGRRHDNSLAQLISSDGTAHAHAHTHAPASSHNGVLAHSRPDPINHHHRGFWSLVRLWGATARNAPNAPPYCTPPSFAFEPWHFSRKIAYVSKFLYDPLSPRDYLRNSSNVYRSVRPGAAFTLGKGVVYGGIIERRRKTN